MRSSLGQFFRKVLFHFRIRVLSWKDTQMEKDDACSRTLSGASAGRADGSTRGRRQSTARGRGILSVGLLGGTNRQRPESVAVCVGPCEPGWDTAGRLVP